MPQFRYEGFNLAGQPKKGTITAPTQEEASTTLRMEMQLFLMKLELDSEGEMKTVLEHKPAFDPKMAKEQEEDMDLSSIDAIDESVELFDQAQAEEPVPVHSNQFTKPANPSFLMGLDGFKKAVATLVSTKADMREVIDALCDDGTLTGLSRCEFLLRNAYEVKLRALCESYLDECVNNLKSESD